MTTTDTAAATLPTAYETGLAAITSSRNMLKGLIEDLSDEQLLAQPCAGGNHVLWQLGHLAFADDYFSSTLGGTPSAIDEQWNTMFGMGSTPVADASVYPQVSEVRAKFESTRATLLDWFASLSDEQLAQPLSEELRGFAKTTVALMTSLAGHEMMHVGQISVVRKSLGLAPKYM